MKASPDGVTGVLLAGGNSSRMGRNKALMPLAGHRLVDRVLTALRGIFDDLLMVTNSPDLYADLGLRMVPDLVAGKGALGGIHSAIHHTATPHCLVVACDMPFLNPDVLRYLVEQRAGYDVVVPSVHGRPQPLHAVYGKACLQPIARRLETDRLHVVGFFPEVRMREVTTEELADFDPEGLSFRNLNTPEEFAAAARRLNPAAN
jgi:molybdopterin-guanine dinucleotide biosynthesis protein A